MVVLTFVENMCFAQQSKSISQMTDVVIVYIAGQEMARGRANREGHVLFNQQTYQNVTDFYNDTVEQTCIFEHQGDLWNQPVATEQYITCYKTAVMLQNF